MKKIKENYQVECGDWRLQGKAYSHEDAVKRALMDKNPKTFGELARVRKDHQRQSERKWFYIDPLSAEIRRTRKEKKG